MRAVFLRENSVPEVDGLIKLDDDRAHHLIKSARIRVGEQVCLFNGEGLKLISEAIEVSKRSVVLKVISCEQLDRFHHIDICLGNPKKEAFELALKNATELGAVNFIPFKSEYSQWDIKNRERAETIVESALIQSNNPFVTKIENTFNSIDDLINIFDQYDAVFLTSLKKKGSAKSNLSSDGKYLILIGPEGGFSSSEEEAFLAHEKVVSLNLPTPILRAPNAVSAATGYLLSKFDTV